MGSHGLVPWPGRWGTARGLVARDLDAGGRLTFALSAHVVATPRSIVPFVWVLTTQWLYLIPRSAASPATRFAASLRDRLRVSCSKRIAFSRSPVLTSPYSRISHLASTPGAAALSHSTRIFPSGMPQV